MSDISLAKSVLKGHDIVIIGQQSWDTEIGSNCKNIAIEMSKHNRVLYVNSPLDRITLYRSRTNPKTAKRLNVIKGKESGLVSVQLNLWNLYPDCIVESINWLRSDFMFDVLNSYNNRKFASSIRKCVKELGFRDYILFNDNEIFKGFYLKELLTPLVSIYYSRDYMLAVDYWKRHGKKYEPMLIAKSDLCVANSSYLTDYCKGYNKNSFYVGQGCELDLFDPEKNESIPADLNNIKKPIIGYVGALESIRLDIAIIQKIAEERPDWSIALVGPEDEVFRASGLHKLPNVFFAGMKPVMQLPSYIKAFDVCINPQLINMVTVGNYPRKIDEYLAMGKPVVATNTKAMEVFKDYVYLVDTKEEYIAFIEKAISEDSSELATERRGFSLGHTWENSVSLIFGAISLYIQTQEKIEHS